MVGLVSRCDLRGYVYRTQYQHIHAKPTAQAYVSALFSHSILVWHLCSFALSILMSMVSTALRQFGQTLASGGLDQWYDEQVRVLMQQPNFNYAQFKAFQERIQRATAPIQYKIDLLTYNACYAASHIARLRTLLGYFTFNFKEDTGLIRVFDYGCGQGLASLVFLEKLQQQHVRLNVELHLIEPSALALQHAEHYVRQHPATQYHDVQILTHLTTLNHLPTIDHPATHTFHLFSNVLDMAYLGGFQLQHWKQRAQQQTGLHVCVAVSPAFISGQLGFKQILALCPDAHVWLNGEVCGEAESWDVYNRCILKREFKAQMLAFKFTTSSP